VEEYNRRIEQERQQRLQAEREIDVAATSLSRIVDTNQRPQEFEANESVPFSRSDYLRIHGWNLSWRL
jgi:hypothetical protein